MTDYMKSIKLVTALQTVSDELDIPIKKLTSLIYLYNKNKYELIIEAASKSEEFYNSSGIKRAEMLGIDLRNEETGKENHAK